MKIDRRAVSSDAFMVTWARVLLKFCDPFLDSTYSKIHLIDSRYPFLSKRLSPLIKDTTRVHADTDQSNPIETHLISEYPSYKSNFISDIFWMTCTYMHYGVLAAIRFWDSVGKQIEEMRGEISRIQHQDRSGWGTRQEEAFRGLKVMGSTFF